MEAFTRLEGLTAALLRDHIDTDIIIPSRDITSPSRDGFGPKLFAPWRYDGPGGPERPDFVLNQQPWRAAVILIAGATTAPAAPSGPTSYSTSSPGGPR